MSKDLLPGFALDKNTQIELAAEFARQFASVIMGDEAALGAQSQERISPIKMLRLALDDSDASSSATRITKIREIPIPHKQIFVHDSNNSGAYFYYRPFDRDDNPAQWIKMIKGKQYNLPFPTKKAYIWYPSQSLLTVDILFSKFGSLQSPEVVNNILPTVTGTSVVTAFMGTGSDTSKAITDAVAVAVLPAEVSRARANLFNDGDAIWIGDSNVAVGRGLKIGAGERFEWSNLGPMYAISDTGGISTIYGNEERQ